MNGFRLLDTVIDPLAGEDIARRIRAALQEPETPALFLVTVNPEILLHAHEEESYRRVLESASLRLIDGMGVKIAALCGGKRAPRTTGRALVAALLDIAAEEGVSAHFVLKSDGLTGSVRLLECLGRRRGLRATVETIARGEAPGGGSDAAIVIVTFGAPAQELWIAKYRHAFPRARVFIGVGGAIDVLCGTLPPPPRIVARLGLEWLWRLVIQPRRLPRILRALFVFPLTVLFHRGHES